MNKVITRVTPSFAIVAVLALLCFVLPSIANAGGMMGGNGMMSGGMWMMMAVWILVVVVLVLLAAALIKYLFSKR